MDETAIQDAVQSATERLLEESWESRERERASRRELIVEPIAAGLFTAAALGLLFGTHALRHLHPGTAALLVVVYALVARIEFPIGAGHVVPTQLLLMPMLVLLPPGVVPVAVAVALALTASIDLILHRAPARRVLSAVPDAWHAIGPALVLVAAGSPAIGLHQLPLMGAAFAASCLFDLASSLTRARLTGTVPDLAVQLRVILSVWVVDASLAPVGVLAGLEIRHGSAAVLFVLPLAFLLWLLSRDRRSRIQQAVDRLALVQHERVRLQSAVRRLGDAFAAKLELDALLEILLNGSVEALDAEAGRLHLMGMPTRLELQTGSESGLRALDRTVPHTPANAQPEQTVEDGAWTLTLPLRVALPPRTIFGRVELARFGRAFEPDEIGLIRELIAKAELAAGEILGHQVLRTQALTDALTGLGNRRKLTADLAREFEEQTDEKPSLLLLFDLDGFKLYNDTFGHLAGDALLSRLAAKLAGAVAGRGDAYRLGGDEFCAHLKLDRGSEPDELIAQAAVALTESGRQFAIRASVGVVLLPHEADSPDHALHLADQRMYASKRGRPGGARNQARDVLMRTMQVKQRELDAHSDTVAKLSVRVARRLGLTGEDLDEVARAAELHDVGKVGIPDAILNKPAALTAEEWEFVHQHTILGERILHAAPALRPIARLVRASHERWDGGGYPDGLAGEDIPLGARIVAVCDAYEAMTGARPYRERLAPAQARAEIVASSGSQFDPAVVDAFLDALDTGDEPEGDTLRDAVAHVRALLRGAPGGAA
jgi:diguanylate cyclase (GGDEF)-like protein